MQAMLSLDHEAAATNGCSMIQIRERRIDLCSLYIVDFSLQL